MSLFYKRNVRCRVSHVCFSLCIDFFICTPPIPLNSVISSDLRSYEKSKSFWDKVKETFKKRIPEILKDEEIFFQAFDI